eukprot:TRINITY_DN7844_c0_g1_i1.p1 TRINITY_DN7844_c0_g1~~TRINITY_DN7844_c0_g1_i1.p1  ORF type:complete len:740 (+),score=144.75 TRINITY_DN7844_c0_g1_i1:76-2220(+)
MARPPPHVDPFVRAALGPDASGALAEDTVAKALLGLEGAGGGAEDSDEARQPACPESLAALHPDLSKTAVGAVCAVSGNKAEAEHVLREHAAAASLLRAAYPADPTPPPPPGFHAGVGAGEAARPAATGPRPARPEHLAALNPDLSKTVVGAVCAIAGNEAEAKQIFREHRVASAGLPAPGGAAAAPPAGHTPVQPAPPHPGGEAAPQGLDLMVTRYGPPVTHGVPRARSGHSRGAGARKGDDTELKMISTDLDAALAAHFDRVFPAGDAAPGGGGESHLLQSSELLTRYQHRLVPIVSSVRQRPPALDLTDESGLALSPTFPMDPAHNRPADGDAPWEATLVKDTSTDSWYVVDPPEATQLRLGHAATSCTHIPKPVAVTPKKLAVVGIRFVSDQGSKKVVESLVEHSLTHIAQGIRCTRGVAAGRATWDGLQRALVASIAIRMPVPAAMLAALSKVAGGAPGSTDPAGLLLAYISGGTVCLASSVAADMLQPLVDIWRGKLPASELPRLGAIATCGAAGGYVGGAAGTMVGLACGGPVGGVVGGWLGGYLTAYLAELAAKRYLTACEAASVDLSQSFIPSAEQLTLLESSDLDSPNTPATELLLAEIDADADPPSTVYLEFEDGSYADRLAQRGIEVVDDDKRVPHCMDPAEAMRLRIERSQECAEGPPAPAAPARAPPVHASGTAPAPEATADAAAAAGGDDAPDAAPGAR